MSGRSLVRLIVILAVGAAACGLVYFVPGMWLKYQEEKPAPGVHLKAGGTSVVAILLENRWRNAYRKERDGVEIDYASIGSTKAVHEVMEGTLPVAFTHAPLTAEERQTSENKGGLVQIPVLLCAVVPIYHVKELRDKPPLKFTGEVLADIFLGKITKWDDPALKKLNEGVELPPTPIVVVHRKDSSGTTFLFTSYLAPVSAAWRERVGKPANKIDWPVGEGQNRNQGVKGHVFATEGAIGYVDLIHASFGDEVQYGAVQNKDQTAFIHAMAPNLTAAVKNQLADIHDDLTFDLTNKPGPDSYPIGGVIWAVCQRDQPAPLYGRVTTFLQWATHDGQRFAANMAFAPLPEELVGRVEQKIKTIKLAAR